MIADSLSTCVLEDSGFSVRFGAVLYSLSHENDESGALTDYSEPEREHILKVLYVHAHKRCDTRQLEASGICIS